MINYAELTQVVSTRQSGRVSVNVETLKLGHVINDRDKLNGCTFIFKSSSLIKIIVVTITNLPFPVINSNG